VNDAADTLVMLIYADPAKSGLTAEALRMAMGLGTGSRTVQVVLMGPAARVLTPDVDELVDGEAMENHLDVFADFGTAVFVGGGGEDYDRSDAPVEAEPVDAETLARMVAEAHQVMVFP
jgi:hypothetical protein